MKRVALLVFGIALALTFPTEEPLGSSEDGWHVPQPDGSFKWVTKEEAKQIWKEVENKPMPSPVVGFYLYTSLNPNSSQQIYTDDADGLKNSNFNPNNPTRFIIHGWRNSYLSDVNVEIRTSLLNAGLYNVICVDWSSVADTLDYFYVVRGVPEVGQKVAAMVDFLHHLGRLSLSSLTIIGHSLGAHVSGFTGKYVTEGEVHSIIGLDPAFPLYSYANCTTRLCETDAYYVESIHTNGGWLGFQKPIGKAAFYPNGGKSQPGCGLDVAGACAHSRSFIYYAEAIKLNDFRSLECSDWEKAVAKDCGATYSATVRLGAPTNAEFAIGPYYTPVHDGPPYG